MTDSQIDLLLNFSIAAAPGGIKQQEAQGQSTLPEGWEKAPTDHSMGSSLVDFEELRNQKQKPKIMTDSQIDLLLTFSIAAAPGGIKQQEAQGQKNLIQSTTLPIKGDWEVLERWGVVRGGPIDKLFCYCTLPEGWEKAPTDHSMWSSLVDARGLIRASIFYKAAFYDRSAHFHSIKRFTIAKVFRSEETSYYKQVQVRDNGLSRVVFIDSPVYAGELDGEIVAIKGSSVYLLKGDKLCLNKELQASKALILIENDFFDKWHNDTESKYVFTDACEELAALECQQYITQLPTDDSIWEPVFDFPEVT